jgi:hypothetical protein
MKQKLSIEVRGKSGKSYCFDFEGDPKHIEEWRAEGLDVVEICNTSPYWVAELGLLRPWIAIQDFWKFIRIW